MSSKRADRWDRCETKRNSNFFVWCFECWLLICELDVDDLMCVWLLFFFLSSDVSTFQKDDYCRDHSMSTSRKKIDYWLDVEDSSKKIDVDWNVVQTDWLTNWLRRNLQLNRFVDLKMLYVNFSFNSRKRHASWSLSKRTFWRFSFKHSRISTSDEDIVSIRFFYEQLTIFFNLAYLYEIDDFI